MKKIRIGIVFIFAAFIALVSGGSLIAKDREFSPNENRYLAEPPEFSVDHLLSGKFQEDLETYLNDQICGRDNWITIKTGIQKACHDTDIGGAYVGKDGYDFEKITPEDVDEKLIDRNVKAVQEYFDSAAAITGEEHLSFLLVPSSGLILKDKLPKNARLFDQKTYMDQIEASLTGCKVVDVRKELTEHKEEDIYYRTDHHWTSEGAYLAYGKWCEMTGNAYTPMDELEADTVTEQFRGSLYSKILDVDSAYDSIWTYAKKGGKPFGSENCSVTINRKQTMDSCYDSDKLKEKDKYKYFFGDNYGEVQIVSGNAPEDSGNILVIKDSFANTFVPLLTQNYHKISMIDLRFYNGDMKEYLKENQITDVLVLYNITNFISDRNIYKLTGGI